MSTSRSANNQFGRALRFVRKQQSLSQEMLDVVSSRTYISVLERGVKSPTLSKADDLANAMGVHPLTLLFLAYVDPTKDREIQSLLKQLSAEVQQLTRLD